MVSAISQTREVDRDLLVIGSGVAGLPVIIDADARQMIRMVFALDFWHSQDKRSWWDPIHRERLPVETDDPLALQIRHFCHVIRREQHPLVTGREGLNTLKVIIAVKESAATGQSVQIHMGVILHSWQRSAAASFGHSAGYR